MQKSISLYTIYILKDHRKILWTRVCQYILTFRQNIQILINRNFTKADMSKNLKSPLTIFYEIFPQRNVQI